MYPLAEKENLPPLKKPVRDQVVINKRHAEKKRAKLQSFEEKVIRLMEDKNQLMQALAKKRWAASTDTDCFPKSAGEKRRAAHADADWCRRSKWTTSVGGAEKRGEACYEKIKSDQSNAAVEESLKGLKYKCALMLK
jgi:hypothetical protein